MFPRRPGRKGGRARVRAQAFPPPPRPPLTAAGSARGARRTVGEVGLRGCRRCGQQVRAVPRLGRARRWGPPIPPPGATVRPAAAAGRPRGGQGGPEGSQRRADGAALADGAQGAPSAAEKVWRRAPPPANFPAAGSGGRCVCLRAPSRGPACGGGRRSGSSLPRG